VNDKDCIGLLQWALPRLQMRWAGFRKVRKQVCKRIARRLRRLDLPGPRAYRQYLLEHPDEWAELDRCCRITLSRFYRDRAVFDFLGANVLPALARRASQRADRQLVVWSAGCAGGEEAYTLRLIWEHGLASRWPALALRILASDLDSVNLERARRACYPASSLKDLPARWRDAAFRRVNADFCLRPGYRTGVEFCCQDLRRAMPERRFDLILCRNLVFTYFVLELQQRMLKNLVRCLRPGGVLVIGAHESLPGALDGLTVWPGAGAIFRAGEADGC